MSLSDPTVLAFDTSGPWISAALLRGSQVLSETYEETARGQAERLMPMLESMLDAEGIVWAEFDAIGVGIGPGNFTGIRISVAAARGLALGLGVPAIGVSGFEVIHAKEARPNETRHLITLATRRGGHLMHEMVQGRLHGQLQQIDETHPMSTRPLLDHGADCVVLGEAAADVAYLTEQQHGRPITYRNAPFPAAMAARLIGRIAAERLASGAALPPPAPMYARPADAAPARDPAPRILP